MRFTRPTIVGVVLALLLSLLAAAPASAGNPVPPPSSEVSAGVDWLLAQQQPDGAWNMSGFGPGFETPDAVLAIATEAQTSSSWSTAEAFAAVDAAEVDGVSPLDWADDFVDAGTSAGLEAKIALLVALPLGLDPEAFNPQEDGITTDLTASLGELDASFFNSFLFARMVEAGIDRNVHQNDVQSICEAQHTNGGWSFDAVADGANGADADTSGFAAMALAAAGVSPSDAVVAGAKTYFTSTQVTTGDDAGSWLSFGSPDPNSTAVAIHGFLATGGSVGDLGADPVPWLNDQQVTVVGSPPDDVVGRFTSPNDGFGINTFPTSQAVQGLDLLAAGRGNWLPLETNASDRECLTPHPFTDVPASAWNDNALRWLDRYGVATGYPDGTYRPDDVFNRAQASLWFDRFFPDVVGAANTFSDVPDGIWYESGADFVGDEAWPNGSIAAGFQPGNEFRANDPFKRGQAVLWMYKAAGRPDVSGLPPHGLSDGAPWYEDALTWAKANGVVTGYPDDTFRPSEQINRAQGAFWFYNLAASPDAWDDAIALPSTIVHTPTPS